MKQLTEMFCQVIMHISTHIDDTKET